MMGLQNLHTHSKYCDGNDTLREMIETAIEKGFDSLGFSGHSGNSFSSYGMTPEKTAEYKRELAALKEEYKGRIKLFCGLEAEVFSDSDFGGFDYVIGSTHYFDFDGKKVSFDTTKEEVVEIIDTYFGGDAVKYAERYYETMSRLYEYGDFDIIGHFDILAKHNEVLHILDEDSKEYRTLATAAIESLKGKIPAFEVNTGCISRGYRKTPYPAPFIIKEFRRQGFLPVISSDCHNRNYLDCNFKEAEELLISCGYKEKYIFTENGFEGVKL